MIENHPRGIIIIQKHQSHIQIEVNISDFLSEYEIIFTNILLLVNTYKGLFGAKPENIISLLILYKRVTILKILEGGNIWYNE